MPVSLDHPVNTPQTERGKRIMELLKQGEKERLPLLSEAQMAEELAERKGRRFKTFLKGAPLMVIYEGKVNYKALKKSKMDINDMMAKAREQGHFDLSKIEYAVFENSGALSVMPKSEGAEPKPELPYYLIDDGHVVYSSLRTLGKSEEWLFKKAKIQNKKDLKNIILAVYDKENDKIDISTKK